MVDPSQNEYVILAAVFVGTAFSAGIAYFKKPKAVVEQNPVVTGVGLELGNRLQVDQLVAEQKRCADYLSSISASMAVLADRKQAMLDDKMDEMKELLERLAEKERRN